MLGALETRSACTQHCALMISTGRQPVNTAGAEARAGKGQCANAAVSNPVGVRKPSMWRWTLEQAQEDTSPSKKGMQLGLQGPGSHRSMVLSLFRRRRASSFELLLSSCCCSRYFICFCREASAHRLLGRLQGLLAKHPGLCALQAAGSMHWLLMLSPP